MDQLLSAFAGTNFAVTLSGVSENLLVSTSANLSGDASPSIFAVMILPQIINGVDYVVAWRQDDESPSLHLHQLSGGKKVKPDVIR